MSAAIPLIGGDEIRRVLAAGDAVEVIGAALRGGLDPGADPGRVVVGTAHGQLLLMPASGAEHAGVKIVSVAPGNAGLGLPRIQGHYLLFDAVTLSPVALLDGVALTTLRTPAVSVAAVLPWLTVRAGPLRVVVFGTGPQGLAHVETIDAVVGGGRTQSDVVFVSRRPEEARVAGHRVVRAGGGEADDALAAADVVVCATTARTPLFDSALLGDRAVVIAVGSHEPDAREVDGALLGRAHVIVEDVDTALREAGDVVLALAEGHLTADRLIPMRRAVTDPELITSGRPVLFKSTGMAWEDLVVAAAVHERAGTTVTA
ncbi:ornithine cyclodeaminase family protein [Actinoplanes sp. G11-F43]|uniref:ornithine cyclodeaminase family protein n=1 Tax=Actinoplanes sp. G11-F43 TaxID=3424130 RepID=UPI003D32490B